MSIRRFHSNSYSVAALSSSFSTALPRRCRCRGLFSPMNATTSISLVSSSYSVSLRSSIVFSLSPVRRISSQSSEPCTEVPTESHRGPLKPGLYIVGTPIGNLEDITLRALRVLRSANVILSEDTRHSGKLLKHYDVKTPLLSYHKFNESQREQEVLSRLRQGEVIAQISDAGTPGISDPGMGLVKSCVNENIPVIPIPGPSALITAISASGLTTDEFKFVGFLPKHASSRRERLMNSSNEGVTQIFFIPPHKLLQFIEEASPLFGSQRQCVIARELTKIHEEFWRGTLEEANKSFSTRQPKGEITLLIEGKTECGIETPSEAQLENKLRELISQGHSLSTAVKLVAGCTPMRRSDVYSFAIKKFAKRADLDEISSRP
ncbi:ribosomal RNA small subunit methyltransferase I isoform X2 [Impatiens glandulifera]|uniref:ribosomal RNA small subunit methyltransferase I isoform X2 n=1 Tax=Impatiens glandulifera TaxID=253017 RepID=UPI001FB05465|nr:ribosomal RNA small subunit methyltransferase I isoform X2 [Impatiens glandulifera]